ncbi:nuclear transport factor 2 family protein [Chromobacterium vaccinii]|uniref:nuclear transport factor 2 family protein n=1 Tax=Chromobacterium vaccinii TaxID=1108595 RepID=UPI000617F55D|nr:nuclear transport factor 2 family protein [Chromobacterium vaccinii]
MTAAERIVQAQLDAYNARNLEAFAACYAEDVKVYRLPAMTLSLSGRAALADHYASKRFNLPKLHAALLHRIVQGSRVIDHEDVTLDSENHMRAVAIYDVNADSLIAAVWFVDAE